jgi:hypothetical protein
MNKLLFYLIAGLLFSFSTCKNLVAQKTDLVNKWDTIRPLINPDKGWYHHMLDNGIGKYLLEDESELKAFPGMDHLYRRLAWAYLEPEEGKYNWSYIDVGSIGEWGEGHTNNSTRIPPTVEEVKANMDIYLKHYKKTQLVVTDDLLYWNKSEKDLKF